MPSSKNPMPSNKTPKGKHALYEEMQRLNSWGGRGRNDKDRFCPNQPLLKQSIDSLSTKNSSPHLPKEHNKPFCLYPVNTEKKKKKKRMGIVMKERKCHRLKFQYYPSYKRTKIKTTKNKNGKK